MWPPPVVPDYEIEDEDDFDPAFSLFVFSMIDALLSDAPAAPDYVARCPVVVVDAGQVCSVCLDGLTGGRELPCAHVFHDSCVRPWFDRQHTCPLCRFSLAGDITNTDNSLRTTWGTMSAET